MVVILLLVALGFRLINLNQSLWLDEAVQAITSTNPLNGIWTEIVGDFHPPLYHIIMWGWGHLFGNSEVILRLPSVLFGVGTAYFGYKIAEQFNKQKTIPLRQGFAGQANNKQQWYTLLLFATSPYLIYYSQEARMYSLSAFLTTLSSYFFILIIQQITSQISYPKAGQPLTEKLITINKKQLLLTFYYLLVNSLLVYTDYYGWLVVLAQGVYLFIHTRRIKLVMLTVVPLIVSYFPWLNMLITQMKAGQQAMQTLPVWVSLVNLSALKAVPLTFVKFTIGRISFQDKHFYLLVVLVLIGIYLTLAIFGLKGWLKNRSNPNAHYINILIYYTFMWLVIPLLVAWLVSYRIPNFQPFRLLLILPAFHLLIVCLILNIKIVRLRRLLFIFIISINMGGYLYYQLTPSMKREDWRALVKYTDINKATLLIPSESSNWPVSYYTNGGTQLVYGATGAKQVIQPPMPGSETVYYLRYLVPVFDPDEKVIKQLQALGYNKTEVTNFNQLETWKFQLAR